MLLILSLGTITCNLLSTTLPCKGGVDVGVVCQPHEWQHPAAQQCRASHCRPMLGIALGLSGFGPIGLICPTRDRSLSWRQTCNSVSNNLLHLIDSCRNVACLMGLMVNPTTSARAWARNAANRWVYTYAPSARLCLPASNKQQCLCLTPHDLIISCYYMQMSDEEDEASGSDNEPQSNNTSGATPRSTKRKARTTGASSSTC